MYDFYLFGEMKREPASSGLSRLTRMVADGALRPRIEVAASLEEVGKVAQRLIERGFGGKAVLHV